MTGQFEMVATLALGKKTEKFNPYEEKEFNSGWVNRSLKFSAIAGTSRHMLEVRGGCWNDGHGDVLTFGKSSTDDSGNKVKGEKLTIKWKDRNKKELIANVAEFKKFVIDVEKPGRRKILENMVKKFEEGNVTDEDVQQSGVSTLAEAQEALEKSNARRREFITAWDFAETLNKVLNNESYKNTKFLVKGDIETTESKGKFYTHFNVTRVYRAADDAETYAHGVVTLCFNSKSLDDGSIVDKHRYYVNGYTFNYDWRRKGNIPCSVTLTIPISEDEKAQKLANLLVKNFTVSKADGRLWKELGIKVNLINGAEVMEFSEDMLSENEKELLMMGEISTEDLIREHGGKVYGDRIQEWQVIGFAKGWLSGAKATTYADEDFVLKEIEEEPEEVTDIFDEDDEDSI
jgi:hypothetical protein